MASLGLLPGRAQMITAAASQSAFQVITSDFRIQLVEGKDKKKNMKESNEQPHCAAAAAHDLKRAESPGSMLIWPRMASVCSDKAAAVS